MGDRLQMLKDMGINLYGLGENVASLGSAAIAEPVAGFAAMYDPVNGAQAIREGMTYQPRGDSAKMYQKGAGGFVSKLVKPVMPVIDTWKQGVDIAGSYSPAAGAVLATAPTALAALLGYKPAMQTGRQVSNGLDMLQRRIIANANAPRTLNAGYMGQRGAVGTQRPLTEFEQAHLTAQRNAALPVNQGGLGLAPDNTAMDRARAMGFDTEAYHGTKEIIDSFDTSKLGQATKAKSAELGIFSAVEPDRAGFFADFAKQRGYNTDAKLNWENQKRLSVLHKKLANRLSTSELYWIRDPDQVFKLQDKLKAGKTKNEILDIAKEVKQRMLARDIFEEKYKPDSIAFQHGTGKYTGENILPLLVNTENSSMLDYAGKRASHGILAKDIEKSIAKNDSGLIVKNIPDPTIGTNIVSYNPSNIRSRFAAFDPFNRDSSNLLAQSAKLAPTAGIAAYLYGQQNKDKQ